MLRKLVARLRRLRNLKTRRDPNPLFETPLPTRRTKLCFLISASPNDSFYGQIAMFRRALNHLGGIYQDAPIVVVFGDTGIKSLPERWRPHFENIFFRWVSPQEFNAKQYMAQLDARYLTIPDCEYIIFADADVMMLKPVDEIFEQLAASPAVAGVIAYLPFPLYAGDNAQKRWSMISNDLIARDIPFDYVHSMVDNSASDSLRCCPFYLNFGFVIMPREIAEQIRPAYLSLRPQVEKYLKTPYFSGQVALTLAIYKHNIPHLELPKKYNFPNIPVLEEIHAAEVADLRVIHYLRRTKEGIDREKIFRSEKEFEQFLEKKTENSEKLLQEHVYLLTNGRYPF